MKSLLGWIALVLFFFFLLHFMGVSYATLAAIAAGVFAVLFVAQSIPGKFGRKESAPSESNGEQ